jgi:hypothetical protein
MPIDASKPLNEIMEFDHVIIVLWDGTITDGPIMHNSEYIGGTMEADIRATPGVYVALVNDDIDDPEHAEGWAVARKTEGCPACGALRSHRPMPDGSACPLG